MDFDDAYRQHGPAVLRFLIRLCGDRAAAEDLLHDAFLSAMRGRHPELEDPRAWLMKVAANRWKDWVRSGQREGKRLASVDGASLMADPFAHPSEAVERAERNAQVSEVLRRLPDRERLLLLLRAEGLRHRELAEALDTTTGSIGTMIARALTRARTAMQAPLPSHRAVEGEGS